MALGGAFQQSGGPGGDAITTEELEEVKNQLLLAIDDQQLTAGEIESIKDSIIASLPENATPAEVEAAKQAVIDALPEVLSEEQLAAAEQAITDALLTTDDLMQTTLSLRQAVWYILSTRWQDFNPTKKTKSFRTRVLNMPREVWVEWIAVTDDEWYILQGKQSIQARDKRDLEFAVGAASEEQIFLTLAINGVSTVKIVPGFFIPEGSRISVRDNRTSSATNLNSYSNSSMGIEYWTGETLGDFDYPVAEA